MTNKTTREYRTATTGTIDSFEREDGKRTDSYVLTASDWVPISPGWPSFGEFLARKKAKADAARKAKAEKQPEPKLDAEAEWKRFVKRITPEVWAEVKAKYRAEKAAEDDQRDAETAKRRAKIGESLRARVEADQDHKWGR
jgi:hypothetical protein